MATIAVVAVGAYLSTGTTGVTAALIAAATAAAAVGTGYLDGRYIYPKLLGEDRPRTPNGIAGIDQMTGEDGAPSHTAWGRAALVGGHVLFFEGLEVQANRLSTKKGGGATMTRRLADIGIAWAHSYVSTIDRIFADQKPFWDRDPNQALWADYRVTFTTIGSSLILTAQVDDVADFDPLLAVGNVVFMEGALSTSGGASPLNGYWRVAAVAGAAVGAVFPSMTLTALSGQTAAIATAGTATAPLILRRIDLGIVDARINFGAYPQGVRVHAYFGGTAPIGGGQRSDTNYARDPRGLLKPGVRVRLEGFSPASVNKRYEVIALTTWSHPVTFPFPFQDALDLRAIDGAAVTPTTPLSTTNPGRIVLDDAYGFYEYSEGQQLLEYNGREDEGPDGTLDNYFGVANVHGYRGIARTTIRKYNLSNFGDRIGEKSAIARVSLNHTTHDPVRDLIAEAFGGEYWRADLSALPPTQLGGFTRRGPQPTSSVLQPLAIAYGIEAQECGDKFRFFTAQTADQIQLREDDFGVYAGAKPDGHSKFKHSQVPDRDLPRVLSLMYRDAVQEHVRKEAIARADRVEDPSSDHQVLDVDPVVLWPWEAQTAVRRLFTQAIVARDQGETVLPPSRCYVLPNDRLTLTALHKHSEECTLVGGAIDHVVEVGPMEVGSLLLEVTFLTRGNCRMIGLGSPAEWTGIPAGMTVTANSIDYATGAIELAASNDTVLRAVIHYEFPNPWRLRVQNLHRETNRTTRVACVAVAEKFSKLGSPVQFNQPQFPPVNVLPSLRFEVLDVPGLSFTTASETARGLIWVACPLPGSDWRPSIALTSTDGANWTTRGVIQQPTPMGTAQNALTAGVSPYTWDWRQELIVAMDFGAPETYSQQQLDQGFGWGLVGDEIICWREAVANEDGTYTLRGLLRGCGTTEERMGSHAIGDRFVILTGAGDPIDAANPNGLYDNWNVVGSGGPANLVGQLRYYKVIPIGALPTQGPDAQQLTVRGRMRRPWSVSELQQWSRSASVEMDPAHRLYNPGAWLAGDVSVRWWRRSRYPWSLDLVAPLWEAYERYRITIKRNGVAVLQAYMGDPVTGAQLLVPVFRLTLAQQTALGFVSTDTAAIVVEQEGAYEYSPPREISWTIP